MIRNKSFINFISAISIATVLLVTITGRTIPVKAVGTTAAIAGTAFVLTGAVYLSYVALTQGEIVLPAAEELHNWLGSIGRKVSQYSSGASAYQDIYQSLARDPAANVIDGVWTWTQERIKSFTNDFSDTRIIENILKYQEIVDVSTVVTNQFDYPFNIVSIPNRLQTYSGGRFYTFDDFITSYDAQISFGNPVLVRYGSVANNTFAQTYLVDNYTVRNYLRTNGTYTFQVFVNGAWSFVDLQTGIKVTQAYNNPNVIGTYSTITTNNTLSDNGFGVGFTNWISHSAYWDYPLFIQADTFIEETGTLIQAQEIVPYNTNLPSWNNPDNNNRPIIPWVPIPQLPINVNPPSGYVNPQWGFNLQDLLDKLEDLAGLLIDIGGIAALINEFAGLHGDEYYIEYNNGDTNYYTYYQPTLFDNDTQYITYNIDVSEQQDTIPVDLNTIQLYTNNDYLTEIKQRSQKFGETLGEYFVFWHNSDPMTVYVIFGSVIVILIGAFIGKWGHS